MLELAIKMPFNIYLVDFMGTGKSVVGRKLARQLNREFLDLDSLIEESQKRPITQIFAQEGELYFRDLEKRVLKEVSIKSNLIISCGGGIVLDKDNIEVMKQTGRIICLSASSRVILKRTHGYKQRPLLNVENPEKRIEELLKTRAPFYAQADFTINTSGLRVIEVVNRILEYIEAKF